MVGRPGRGRGQGLRNVGLGRGEEDGLRSGVVCLGGGVGRRFVGGVGSGFVGCVGSGDGVVRVLRLGMVLPGLGGELVGDGAKVLGEGGGR